MTKAYLEVDDIKKLERAATCFRDRLLIRVLFYVGCRVSEAVNLEVKNIDFSEGTLTIEHLKARTRLSCPKCRAKLGKGHIYCPRCGARVEEAVAEERERRRIRTLPVDRETLELLRNYVTRGGPITRRGKQLVFDVNRHRGWQIIKECADRAGLGKSLNPETGKLHNVSPHRLRDAFAVNVVKHDDSGDGLRLLQEQLGHVSITTTMHYRKVAGKELKEWYHKFWQEKGSG